MSWQSQECDHETHLLPSGLERTPQDRPLAPGRLECRHYRWEAWTRPLDDFPWGPAQRLHRQGMAGSQRLPVR